MFRAGACSDAELHGRLSGISDRAGRCLPGPGYLPTAEWNGHRVSSGASSDRGDIMDASNWVSSAAVAAMVSALANWLTKSRELSAQRRLEA